MRLEDLLQIYRRGMVRKAQAHKVAVERGLQPPRSSRPTALQSPR
jgi:hypothetical protein